MTTTLTALQKTLLTTAAARADGSLFPVADSQSGALTRVRKAVPVLLDRGLVREVEAPSPQRTWRRDGDQLLGACITNAGRDAVGLPRVAEEAAADDVNATPPLPTKKAQVLALLRREEGATLAELVAATGWLPHTTRAALTGLRKKGFILDKSKRAEITCYRIAEAA